MCSGDDSRKRKLSAVDLKTYKKEEEYADFYQDGDVYSPLEFLVKNGYDVKKIGNEEKQVEFIQEDGVECQCRRRATARCGLTHGIATVAV